MSAQDLKSRGRRYQLPFAIDQERFGRGYTPLEAFLTILARQFSEGMHVNSVAASDLVAKLPAVLPPCWNAIRKTATLMTEGRRVVDEILCGVAHTAPYDGIAGSMPVCGTHAQIQKKLVGKNAHSLLLTSGSRAAALLLRLAHDHSIEISEALWTRNPKYRALAPPLEATE